MKENVIFITISYKNLWLKFAYEIKCYTSVFSQNYISLIAVKSAANKQGWVLHDPLGQITLRSALKICLLRLIFQRTDVWKLWSPWVWLGHVDQQGGLGPAWSIRPDQLVAVNICLILRCTDNYTDGSASHKCVKIMITVTVVRPRGSTCKVGSCMI